MILEFQVAQDTINIGEFINNILQKIHVGGNNVISKDNFNYSVDYGDNAIFLVLIRNDLYSEEVVKNWLNNHIGNHIIQGKIFIRGFEYAEGVIVIMTNNNTTDITILIIFLGCYNDKKQMIFI